MFVSCLVGDVGGSCRRFFVEIDCDANSGKLVFNLADFGLQIRQKDQISCDFF